MRKTAVHRAARLAISAILTASFFAASSFGVQATQTRSDFVHKYLEQQFDWGMFIDLQPVQHYLKYAGSKLAPLKRARIYFRVYPRSAGATAANTQLQNYEEFWYHNGKPIGLRRRIALNLDKDKTGIIVVGDLPPGTDSAVASTNALIRLLLDLQFQSVPVSVVVVPDADYKAITANLEHYGFSTEMARSEGKQLSVHLRSSSSDHDDNYYLAY